MRRAKTGTICRNLERWIEESHFEVDKVIDPGMEGLKKATEPDWERNPLPETCIREGVLVLGWKGGRYVEGERKWSLRGTTWN